VLPGKSRRIAEKQQCNVAALIGPNIPYKKEIPIFDVKKATAVIPDVDWSGFSPSFNLDSRKLRRYVVEDVMFGDPKARERLLILVSMHHDTFDSTWLQIYKLQEISRVPVMFDNEMFFQVEAEIIKNPKRKDYIDGLVNEDDVKYQLTVEGGAGVCLHFPGCDKSYEIELKFATIFLQSSTFQVWGTRKIGRDFHGRLVKLRNDVNREALYSRYLIELYGDSAQTLYLSANYKLFEMESSSSKKLNAASSATPRVCDDTSFSTLPVVGADYNAFVKHVDGVFEKAVKECYGRFVSLTEPIVSQTTINLMVDMFKSQFKELNNCNNTIVTPALTIVGNTVL
jgi:hypothetical protein